MLTKEECTLMEKHIEIIDGQEVIVKVYTPSPLPKKITASGGKGKLARMKKQKQKRIRNE